MAAAGTILYANGPTATTLTAQANATDTSFTIASATNWPAPGTGDVFYVKADDANGDLVRCTARSGTTVTCDALAHTISSGVEVRVVLNAAGLLALPDRFVTIDTNANRATAGSARGEKGALHISNDRGYTVDFSDGAAWTTIHGNPPRCRVYNSANQSTSNGVAFNVGFDSERYDTDSMHYTSSAALTGTVAKTASSATLTGTSTSFTTELSVGQIISVPGIATERRVVTAIASNTSLTVDANFANSSSGQTATRVNSGIVIRTPGIYLLTAGMEWASNSTGYRQVAFQRNRGSTRTDIATETIPAVNGTGTRHSPSVVDSFNQWDWIEIEVLQNSTTLNLNASANYSPELSATWQGYP